MFLSRKERLANYFLEYIACLPQRISFNIPN